MKSNSLAVPTPVIVYDARRISALIHKPIVLQSAKDDLVDASLPVASSYTMVPILHFLTRAVFLPISTAPQ
ncbi:MAG TPA: hypothetical protein VJT81_14960 [Burkholderiales bacterium]|nr:hypothetical protein [Burkholderiales bacterium]